MALAVMMSFACTQTENGSQSETQATESATQSVTDGNAEATTEVVSGQVLYVPIYSSIFYTDAQRTLELAAMLSIHNTDRYHSITVSQADYHGLSGKLLKSFMNEPRILKPLETVNIVIEERDDSGGTGANFIITWTAAEEVTEPVVEALMVSTRSTSGISFTTQAKVLEDLSNSKMGD